MYKPKAVIWLDDRREVSEKINSFCSSNEYKLIRCNDYFSARGWLDILFLQINNPSVIVCFDHDLSGRMTGYDLAKYIVENELPIEGFEIHTDNPVGHFNIEQLLTHYGYKNII